MLDYRRVTHHKSFKTLMHNLPGYRVLSKARGGISYGKTFQAIQAFVTGYWFQPS